MADHAWTERSNGPFCVPCTLVLRAGQQDRHCCRAVQGERQPHIWPRLHDMVCIEIPFWAMQGRCMAACCRQIISAMGGAQSVFAMAVCFSHPLSWACRAG